MIMPSGFFLKSAQIFDQMRRQLKVHFASRHEIHMGDQSGFGKFDCHCDARDRLSCTKYERKYLCDTRYRMRSLGLRVCVCVCVRNLWPRLAALAHLLLLFGSVCSECHSNEQVAQLAHTKLEQLLEYRQAGCGVCGVGEAQNS